ncbi:hypothetical protein Slin15195_G123550 [Septoria linicola]|uniref:Uncharacterized protein n=1 Tax=Septoria linicola TaxID=215465 RepID=A0A9Q9B9W7_9PEZI|nr:hypothetical protein Slin14017_G079750 [Septoria linicola]USW59036.1 hypothetical protein Slin15195_G123550 [Septoria linicola]
MPLSQKQMEYLALAWQCFDAEPKIDYDRFKEVAGLASAASARELMRVTKKKLKEEYGALSGGMKGVNAANGNTPNGSATTSPVKKAPRTPAPKRAGGRTSASASAAKRARSDLTSNDDDSNDNDDEEHLDTPVAKKIKTPAPSTKKKTENGVVAVKKEPVARDDGSDDDGDFLG